MIGSGIFAAPAVMASYVGPAGIIAYIMVVISVWFTAISLARLAELYPHEGAFYTYASQWGGNMVGLIAGFCYYIGLVCAMGLLAQVTGTYLHTLVPNISSSVLGLMLLTVLIILNLYGAALSTIGQQILICTTVFPLIAITLLCFSKASIHNLFPFAPHGAVHILKATRIVIFSFFGFECAASLFSLVENPKQNVPRALMYSIAIVGIIYTLFITSIILAVPMEHFADPRIPLSETLQILFPQYGWLLLLVHCAILSALIGTIHSMIWSSGALVLFLCKKICAQRLHTTAWLSNQNTGVLLVGAGIFTTFFLLKSLNLFFYVTAFFIETAFVLSLITLLTLKSEWKSGKNGRAILGLITSLAIVYFAIEGIAQEMINFIQH